jgi:CDP-diacylglycerol--glycerol-3-phosphate 3-phosphatidyltransferase
MDLFFSLVILAVAVCVLAAYSVRVVLLGQARSARVAAEGHSALLGSAVLEMLYWSVVPVAELMARAGVSADAVTWTSLGFGLAAGVALGAGHFGLGALLALISVAGDAIDGFVARATGTASGRGEVLDAAVDRYVEFAFLAGVAVALRKSEPLLLLTLAALTGSFMVSYSTARADALGVRISRGPMRRTERAVVLISGACLAPIAASWRPSYEAVPIAGAVALVAVLGNLSAIYRLAAIRSVAGGPPR